MNARFLLFVAIAFLGSFGVKANVEKKWSRSSPGQNMIVKEEWCGKLNTSILCLQQSGAKPYVVSDVEAWYFFKDHIIGISSQHQQFHFFIFKESDCSLYQNLSADSLQIKIKEWDLQPKYWTRWFNEDWVYFQQEGLMKYLNLHHHQSQVLVIATIALLYAIFKRSISFKWRIGIALLSVGIGLWAVLLDMFPLSF